jgi:uncharacterized membrane protein
MSDKRASEEGGDAGKREAGLRKPHPIAARLRTYFFAGVLVVAPIGITLYIAWLILDFVDSRITPLIPARYNPERYLPFDVPGLGVIIVLIVITAIGATAASFVGRLFVRISERVLARMPVIRGIYGAVKQLVESVFSQKAGAFRQVVLVEWPREGTWTLGFLSTSTAGEIQRRLPQEVVSVMVPTTPNPTSGYLVFVPKEAVVPLEMSVEDAMKMVLSSGIVVPPYPADGRKKIAAGRAEAAERAALR